MKKSFLIFAIFAGCFTAASAKGADDKNPVRFGIKAGFNAANVTVDNDGNLNDKRAIAAWQAGVYVDLPLLPILSIQPGVMLNSKGAKYTIGDNNSSNYTEVSTRPLYLEVPVNAVVKIPLGAVKLFVGAGPYGAMGIGGKNKTEGKLLGVSFSDSKSIKYSNDDPQTGSNGSTYNGDLKRFDFGVNVLAGVEISRLTLNANYGYGLVNIKPGSDNDKAKYQNRVFSVAVGVLF